MKVSVLIPVYNCEQYLPECLASVLAQDFKDAEILIADDGSQDGTVELIRQSAARDARIRWWQNPKNLGQAQNHNALLRAARGEYIKFVHADDKFLQPTALTRMVKVLDADATISLVGTGSNIIDAEAKVLEQRNNFRQSGVWDGKSVIVKCLEENQNLIGEPTLTLFRRHQASRGVDPQYRQILDLEMWFHLLEQGRFGYLAEPLFAYRVHPQQETATIRKSGGDAHEYLALVTEYYRKPWMKDRLTRKLLVTQIRSLRKRSGTAARPLTKHMMGRLKPYWYAYYWFHRKLARLVKKGNRSMKKRLAPKTA